MIHCCILSALASLKLFHECGLRCAKVGFVIVHSFLGQDVSLFMALPFARVLHCMLLAHFFFGGGGIEYVLRSERSAVWSRYVHIGDYFCVVWEPLASHKDLSEPLA